MLFTRLLQLAAYLSSKPRNTFLTSICSADVFVYVGKIQYIDENFIMRYIICGQRSFCLTFQHRWVRVSFRLVLSEYDIYSLIQILSVIVLPLVVRTNGIIGQ